MLALSSVALALGLLACGGEKPAGKRPGLDRFQVGQRWDYHTRFQDRGSTLVILRLETLPDIGRVVHVSVQGVRMLEPGQGRAYSNVIPHMPFSLDALDRSVTRLVGVESTLPPFEERYDQWKAAFARGEAGVFNVPVADAVEATERVMLGGAPREASPADK